MSSYKTTAVGSVIAESNSYALTHGIREMQQHAGSVNCRSTVYNPV